MTKDYRNIYLSDYVNLLSNAFDYALTDLKINPDFFENIFASSRYSYLIEILNPGIVSGTSGVELVLKIIDEKKLDIEIKEKEFRNYRTSAFWVGYALAYYQFYKRKRFKDIFRKKHLKDILNMYNVYHEMDINNFIDDFDKMLNNIELESKLKIIRERYGLSQNDLAKLSNVSLRSIQLYEQKVNDIDKAQANTLYKLATALSCSIEDLLENPER
ncbi:MAG: helix-turn-helix transcriptional regulator [bacterium]|nr:helix-turn-helix transcriptional regulator [bacterium]